jgi:hypothetical protein
MKFANTIGLSFLYVFGVICIMSTIAQSRKEDCACTKIYFPVCGSDGNEYNNECLAECEQGVIADCTGRCPCPDSHSSCTCPAKYAPVCGSDGYTYNNDCNARCNGKSVSCEGSDCPCKTVSVARRILCNCCKQNAPEICSKTGIDCEELGC